MSKKEIYSVFLFFVCLIGYSQGKNDSIALNFRLEFNKLPLKLNKQYTSASGDTLTVETFRCYISDIKIHYQDQSVFSQKNSYHLLDSDKPDSFIIPITGKSNKLISKITFNIGIDSLTNTSGALAGDLDPSKGMYWAWQSGYINMKIEGKSTSCKTRKNEFQFHLGGYRDPYYAMRQIKFDLDRKAEKDISIGIDLFSFFSNVKLSNTNSIMIPGKQAMMLANYSTQMFYLQ